ncbi:unnamed protein product [Dicrocoelium dendriticum]|nr:unnamed protein product [Dicrocoelium dendriticum]
MSKICDPSKIPSIPSTSDPKPAPTSQPFLARNSPFAKSRRPDQGFLEIDASHFTLTPSAASLSPNAHVSLPTPVVKPRTKAQLRSLYRDSNFEQAAVTSAPGGAQRSAQSVSENPTPRRAVARPVSRYRRSGAARGRRPSGSRSTDTPSFACERMQEHQVERRMSPIPESRATTSAPVSTPQRMAPCAAAAAAASTDPFSVIVVDDDQEHEGGDPTSGSEKQSHYYSRYTAFSDPFGLETPKESEALNSLVDRLSFNGKSLTFDDLAVVTLSSQDLTPHLDGDLSRRPHLISLQLPSDREPRSSCYLLLGDVARIICLLEANPACEFCLSPLLRHCRRSKYLFWVRHLCMRTPLHTLHLGSLTVNRRGFDWTNPESKQQLFLIAWPSCTLSENSLTLASSQLPPEFNWRTSASKFAVMKAVSKILLGEPVRRAVSNHSSLKRLLTGVDSPKQVCPPTIPTEHTNAYKENSPDADSQDVWISSLPTSFRSSKIGQVFTKYEVASLGHIVGYLRVICQGLFVNQEARLTTKSATESGLNDPNMSSNLFTCMFDLHSTLSDSLRCLRDSYASLVSAGSCLTARYALSVSPNVDSEQLRIERGRARLFATDGAARLNIARILSEVIHPTLCKLTIKLGAISKLFHFILHDSLLLGPFAQNRSRATPHSESEAIRHRMVCVLSEGTKKAIMTDGNHRDLLRLCCRTFDCLENSLAPFIRELSTELRIFETHFLVTKRTLAHSWMPAYTYSLSSVDARASEDLKFLASILQSQYDVLEAWIRVQHNSVIPVMGQQLLELFHSIFSADDGVPNLWDWRLPNTRLYSPYGSKNTEELNMRVKPVACTPLPEWPPIIIHRADTVLTATIPSEELSTPVSSMVAIVATSVAHTQPPVCTEAISSQIPGDPLDTEGVTSDTDCVMLEPSDSDPPQVSDNCNGTIGNSSSTKRICIYVPKQSDGEFIFSTSIRSNNSDEEAGMACVDSSGTALIDRRRLGKLKRKMKITHSAFTNQADIELDQTDNSGVENGRLNSSSPAPVIDIDGDSSPKNLHSFEKDIHSDIASHIQTSDVSACSSIVNDNSVGPAAESDGIACAHLGPAESCAHSPPSEPNSWNLTDAELSCTDPKVTSASVEGSVIHTDGGDPHADMVAEPCDVPGVEPHLRNTNNGLPITQDNLGLTSVTNNVTNSDTGHQHSNPEKCSVLLQTSESSYEVVLPTSQSKAIPADSLDILPAPSHSCLLVDTDLATNFDTTTSEPLPYDIETTSEVGPISAPAFPDFTSSNSSEISKLISTCATVTANGVSNLTIDKVAADLQNMSPWLREHLRCYHAPGPVTAAILAQVSSPNLQSAVSIDLTSDD